MKIKQSFTDFLLTMSFRRDISLPRLSLQDLHLGGPPSSDGPPVAVAPRSGRSGDSSLTGTSTDFSSARDVLSMVTGGETPLPVRRVELFSSRIRRKFAVL